MKLFKTLSPAEEAEYRAAARAKYTPFDSINGVFHPVYQDECVKMNAELGYSDSAMPNLPSFEGTAFPLENDESDP
jgi:hypothetical protein